MPRDFRPPPSRRDWTDRPVLSQQIKRPTDNLQQAFPRVLILGALILVVLGVVMSLAAHRTDAQVSTLRSHGVPVVYSVSGCANGRISSACTGSFSYAHHTYDDSLSGLQHRSKGGTRVAALVDPEHPSAYVYARGAVFGRQSIGRNQWYVGGLVSLTIAIILGTFGVRLEMRRRRQSTT
jgi:uncharacterized membrane protein